MDIKGFLGLICHGTRLGTKLGVFAIQAKIARGRAIRAFARELRGMGLPGDVVKELSREYPRIRTKDFKNISNRAKSSLQ